MTWTTRIPDKPGYYWFRWTPKHTAEILHIQKMDCGCLYQELNWIGNRNTGQWSSEPITEPEAS